MNATCGCCEGIEKLTPMKIVNRPGLDTLKYRVGTHATFLETMIARLSDLNLLDDAEVEKAVAKFLNPLLRLKTRDVKDPSMAFLDAWAAIADVLTFYQERIANEGFLRTAKERRSILELARLIGYQLSPGVSATVYLSFIMEAGYNEVIPFGTRVKSIPRPGELPQFFETAEPLPARAEWNMLKPRMARPQKINETNYQAYEKPLYFKGIALNLNPNDTILIDIGPDQNGNPRQQNYTIIKVEIQLDYDRTKVYLQATTDSSDFTKRDAIISKLLQPTPPAAIPPLRTVFLSRSTKKGFKTSSDLNTRLLTTLKPEIKEQFQHAWRNAPVTEPSKVKIYVMRLKASLFGHNVPLKITFDPKTGQPTDWVEWQPEGESVNTLYLDNAYDQIVIGSLIAIKKPTKPIQVFQIKSIVKRTRTNYGISANTTEINLPDGSNWWDPSTEGFDVIRGTVVYAQSDVLELAEEPIEEPVGIDPQQPERIELAQQLDLDAVYEGLDSGRWVVITGERIDLPATQGVVASELVMLAGASQNYDEQLPGEKTHTRIQFANKLKNAYKRDTVRIFANVVRATHGETQAEVLGSGNSSQSLQKFQLRRSPLTFISATTPAGIESSLEVRVNDVEWRETDSLAERGPNDRLFISRTNNKNITFIGFGNGLQGARLPTGVENVHAVYRVGIGETGNVVAGQISQLVTKPLGVKKVINPLPATGGANREETAQARGNASIPLKALDRTVSVQDYADFARAFAGIGKADAVRLSDGRRELVHVTIAGTNDIPIDKSSDLYRNLVRALYFFGDPYQPLLVEVRELKLIIINAAVKLLADYKWEFVEPVIRATLLEAFGFTRRAIGQDLLLSEVIGTIQSVAGIDYVDVNILDAVGDDIVEKLDTLAEQLEVQQPRKRVLIHKARVDFSNTDPTKRMKIRPGQLAILSSDIPDTLILSEISA